MSNSRKASILAHGTALFLHGICSAETASIAMNVPPEALAQQQLNAYNARNLDAFLEPYSEDVQIYYYPGKLAYSGKEAMRSRYEELFRNTPGLHCELVNRIVIGQVVIDRERILRLDREPVHAVAVYTVENGKIARVEFINDR